MTKSEMSIQSNRLQNRCSTQEATGRTLHQPRTLSFITALLTFVCAPVDAFAQTSTPRDLTQISLEDLLNIKVVSVSRKEQKLSETGAAIFVITQDDIQRSGA